MSGEGCQRQHHGPEEAAVRRVGGVFFRATLGIRLLCFGALVSIKIMMTVQVLVQRASRFSENGCKEVMLHLIDAKRFASRRMRKRARIRTVSGDGNVRK